MDTQEILFNLEQVKEKEKDKKYFTGELNVYAMVIDVIDFIKEQERTIHSLDCELADIYYPRPYEFEELKKGMWVWREFFKGCLKIRELSSVNDDFRWIEFTNGYVCEFEKNTLFPLTKTMEYQRKEDEND